LRRSILRGSSGALAARAPNAGIFIDMDKGQTVVDMDKQRMVSSVNIFRRHGACQCGRRIREGARYD